MHANAESFERHARGTHCIVDAVPGVRHQLILLLLDGPVARPGRPKCVHLQASGLPEPCCEIRGLLVRCMCLLLRVILQALA